ncbi:ABC transporter ATP-binding protein [Mesorhizobium australicum]|uniref:Amino acid/amide ABC transporter ATP-binding protein 1, HAAT family n=1 Tax=Mesorhizobium australicum TaxID=536018 RepID=A0A1X7MTF2_9HYPH|nr:ABC transporter ATP-binding protein [Mesorhizobium australicum]SMH27618.1 amino acid/amide ABC transporter ATP-binding protein 1, HAAT family [Mesorhizobium australicum]
MSEEQPIIEARGLTRSFHGFVAVNKVDLRVRLGSVHALIGPNGAGKSTLFNLITKFLAPTEGRIFYKGEDITALRPDEISRKGMVRSFQISSVFPHLSVHENVRVALQARSGATYSFWKSDSRLDAFNGRVDELLDSVGLAAFAHVSAVELPYGRKRALELATTLALDPEVLLLDEPMAGMGREDIARTADLIRTVSRSHTVLMVEHNLGVVADLSDTITVLRRGEVLAEGSYAEVSANAEVQKAYMGGGHHAH